MPDPITLSPEQSAQYDIASSATPATPPPPSAPTGEPVQLTPEQVNQYNQAAPPPQAQPIDPLKTFSSDQLVSLANQDHTFDPAAQLAFRPDLQSDPATMSKVADALHQLRSQPWYQNFPGPVQMGKNAVGMAKGFGAQVKDIGANLFDLATLGAMQLDGDVAPEDKAAAQDEVWNRIQQRVAEQTSATESAATGLVSSAVKGAEAVGRATGLSTPLANYTPQDKLNALYDAMARAKQQSDIAKGHGTILGAVGSNVVQNLEAQGKGIRPEEVQQLAQFDPFAWEAFGLGTKGMGALARAATPEVVQNAAQAVGDLAKAGASKAAGKALTAAAVTAKLPTYLTEKLAPAVVPVTGAIGGGFAGAGLGGIPGAAAGVLEGLGRGAKMGASIAGRAAKTMTTLDQLADVGRQISGNAPLVSGWAALGREAAQAVPGTAARVAGGAAFDVANAIGAETPAEKESITPLGTAFGFLGGAKYAGTHVLSGMIANERAYGSPLTVPNTGNFPALNAVHDAGYGAAEPGIQQRVNALRGLLKGAAPDSELFYAPRPASGTPDTLPDTLQGMGLSPEQAQTFANQDAFKTEINGKPVVIVRDIGAGPHDALHAIDSALGGDAVRALNDSVQQQYTPEQWQAFINHYGNLLTTTGKPAADPAAMILDQTGWGDAAARENIIREVHDTFANNNESPDPDTFKQTAGAEIQRRTAEALQSGKSLWESELTPEQQQDVINQYIASEVRAENFDSWYKGIGDGQTLPDKLTRAVAGLVSKLGGNPVANKFSDLGFPLDYGIMQQAGETASRGRPSILPSALPRVTAPPGSPAAQSQQTERNKQIAESAPDVALPGAAKTQKEIMGILNEAAISGNPVDIQYGHAGGTAPAAGADTPPAAVMGSVNRADRRAVIDAWRALPIETRSFMSTLFTPERFDVTKNGKYQVYGGSHAVLAANAQKLATFALAHPEIKLPEGWAVDPESKSFTPDAWKLILEQVNSFSHNQMTGRTGAGNALVVPKMKGYYAPPVTGSARAIPQDAADAINALYGTQTPTTAAIRKEDVLPLNLAGQKVSEATQPGRVAAPTAESPEFGEGSVQAEKRAAALGIKGQHVLETNPFLQTLNQYDDAPSFIEARRRLNLEHMADVAPAPAGAPTLKGNTLTLAAGFRPSTRDFLSRMEDTADNWRTFVDPYKGQYGGGLTGMAADVGAHVASPAELKQLRDAQQRYGELASAAMAQKDYESAMSLQSKSQAAREAAEMAEGGGTAEFVKKYYDPNYQAPFAPREATVNPDAVTFIVRHGSTEMNNADPAKDLIRGHLDVPLDDKGRQEAQEAAKEIADAGGVQTIIHSDLSRTTDTARAIQEANPGAKMIADPRFRPWKLGPTIEGHPTKDMIPVIQDLIENPDKRPPGGETRNEFQKRFLAAFHDAQDNYPDHNTAIVTHYRGSKLLQAWRDTGVDNDNISDKLFAKYEPGLKPGNVEMLDKSGAQFKPGESEEERKIRLTHWSAQRGLSLLNPAFHGTGIAGAESARAKAYPKLWIPRTYFGMRGYKPEAGLGPNKYSAEVAANKLYDFQADPQGLYPSGEDLEKAGYAPMDRQAAASLYEQRIRDAGYEGYFNKDYKVAAKFTPTAVGGGGAAQFKPQENAAIRKVAADYMKKAGREGIPLHTGHAPVNESLAKEIADWYMGATHAPEDPAVKQSYDAFVKETKAQWDHITNQGVTMEPWRQPGQPYANSEAMMHDVRTNKHLWFFPTERGFGPEDNAANHPLLKPSGVTTADGKPLLVNDLFRAVHDYFGHAKEGYSFGPRGELNAYLSHSRMYSDEARPAMAAETLGQNSWVNYGEHLRNPEGDIPARGEPGFVSPADRPYAEQKATVLPDRFSSQFSPRYVGILDHGAPRMEPDHKVEDQSKLMGAMHSDYGWDSKANKWAYWPEDKRVSWWNPPTDDDRFAVENYLNKRGLPVDRHTQALTRETIARAGEPTSAQFSPAESAGAAPSRKEIADAKKEWNEKGTDSSYFKRWFGGSKVVNPKDGTPLVVYHGTTHRFSEFRMDRANPENFLGKGHYFSTDEADASANYAGEGPDLTNRIEDLAEQILAQRGLAHIGEDEINAAYETARKRLVGQSPRTLSAYLKIENPAVFSDKGGTHFYFDYDESTGQETGSAVDLYHSLLRVGAEWGDDVGQKVWDKLTEHGSDDITANGLLAAANDLYIENREGKLASSEFVRQVLQDMGFDGIVLKDADEQFPNMAMAPGTDHYIVWDSSQVKSVNNRGTFSSGNPKVQFRPSAPAPEDFQDEKTLPGALAKPNWAILTGTQEALGPATNEANNRNNDLLKSELVENGYAPKEVQGAYNGLDQGRSFLVTGMTPEEALAWGKRYKQESVLVPGGYLYNDNTIVPVEPENTVIGDEAIKQPGWSRVENGPPFSLGLNFDKRQPYSSPAEQMMLGGEVERKPLSSSEAGQMTDTELKAHYPEAVVPKRVRDAKGKLVDPEIGSDIVNSPLAKQAGSRDAAVKSFADKLADFANQWKDHPAFKSGLRWYSEFVPMLKKEFGKHTNLMAELLAATSPQTAPSQNFAYAYDAYHGFTSGRFDKQIAKYKEGLEKLEDGTWEKWAKKQGMENPTQAAFLGKWIDDNNLLPRQSNGEKFGTSSRAVLQVLTRTWLKHSTGPKTLNFVKNLLGTGHGATIDVWADRTMRRLGYEGFQDRWRILPQNKKGVSDADFAFSQEAFKEAAKQLGVRPDSLQGALWFAEKQLWADKGWGRLDLGDFREEMKKIPLLRQGIEHRLAATRARESAEAPPQQQELLVSPRPMR